MAKNKGKGKGKPAAGTVPAEVYQELRDLRAGRDEAVRRAGRAEEAHRRLLGTLRDTDLELAEVRADRDRLLARLRHPAASGGSGLSAEVLAEELRSLATFTAGELDDLADLVDPPNEEPPGRVGPVLVAGNEGQVVREVEPPAEATALSGRVAELAEQVRALPGDQAYAEGLADRLRRVAAALRDLPGRFRPVLASEVREVAAELLRRRVTSGAVTAQLDAAWELAKIAAEADLEVA